jgi:Ca2+-binding EF-hand superfamily protein
VLCPLVASFLLLNVLSTQAWLTSYHSSEFHNFVERTEKELFSLFHSIDRDHNGKLDKEELKAAFKRAGLTVPNSKLDQFFAEVDENHDVCLYYIRMPTATI